MYKHRTPKYMKVADVRNPSFEYFIRILVVPFHNDWPILSVAGCFNCLSPKMFWEDWAIQHCSCCLNECSISPFSYSILFRSIGRSEILRNSFLITKTLKVLVFEFSAIVSPDLFNFDIILIFNVPDKWHDSFSCLTLFGQEVNPSISWVFIHYDQSILLMVNGHWTDRSKKVHMKKM